MRRKTIFKKVPKNYLKELSSILRMYMSNMMVLSWRLE
jgi:hypothetical protein